MVYTFLSVYEVMSKLDMLKKDVQKQRYMRDVSYFKPHICLRNTLNPA